MKIIEYSFYKVSLPTRRKHIWASSTVDVGVGYGVIKVVTDDGIIGWGEASVMPEWGGDFCANYGESAETMQLVIERHLFPAIEGMDPFDIDLIHTKMELAIRGYPYAKAAIDIALHDIMGKSIGKPIYQLLGGKNRDRIPLTHSLGLMPIEKAVEEAVEAVREGIKFIKVKGGLDYERDFCLIESLRSALGPAVQIFIDANQGYKSAKEAVKWVSLMNERFNLAYLEQPVQGRDQLRQITKMLNIPVCVDESCWSPADALDIVKHEIADYISIYTGKSGGLYPGRLIARIAENAGISCNVNGSGEFGIGNAANLHLAACGKNLDLSSVFPVTTLTGHEQTTVAGRWYLDDIITKPFKYEDGCLIVPDGPGLGIEIDVTKLVKYSN